MQIAVVTGSGKGLGREIANGLSQRGFTLLVTDIDGEAAAATASAIGGGAWSMAQDVRDPESHRAIARAANERGSLELWVNNAGVLYSGSAWDHTDEQVRQTVEVNVLGVMWGSRAAVEAMRANGGQLINIASISALTPAPGLAVYGATKQAVLGFTTSLAGDLDRAGLPIRVSAVCPHAINTAMIRDIQDDPGADAAFVNSRLLTQEEVAKVVVELVDKPRLAVTVPRSQGALAHVLRPFPETTLKMFRPLLKLGQWQRRRANEKR
jgi:NAD(P)-dependent dehydrogenase (short-subunit alcohol dehydrogenase family)